MENQQVEDSKKPEHVSEIKNPGIYQCPFCRTQYNCVTKLELNRFYAHIHLERKAKKEGREYRPKRSKYIISEKKKYISRPRDSDGRYFEES